MSASRPGTKRLLGLVLILIGVGVLLSIREANRILSFPISAWKQDPVADCAVVLTGGAGRVREGMALVEKGLVKTLIISGVNPNTDLYDLVTPMDLSLGVKPSQIILERRSLTTYGNARQSGPILEALRCGEIVLITSQIHMYRAKKTFEAALPETIKIVPHAVPASKSEEENWNLTTEVLKSLFYSLWAYS